MAALAAKVLGGYQPTHVEIVALAGSVLAQSEPKKAPVKTAKPSDKARKRLKSIAKN